MTLDQLWALSLEWYSNRLTVESQRPKADEMARIFARVGLTDPFWDPNA